MNASEKMEKIVSLCKRRGFVFQSSEIYGGLNGFWDYGPLGTELKRNLKNAWWEDLVHQELLGPDGKSVEIVGLDSTIIMNPKIWVASGHAAGFNDPMVDCKKCKSRFRADQMLVAVIQRISSAGQGSDAPTLPNPQALLIGMLEINFDDLAKRAKKKGIKIHLGDQAPEVLSFIKLEASAQQTVACPACLEAGGLTEPRPFNLMFETYIGALRDESSKSYLRPETAQGIFVNFHHVVDTSRVRVPFGIAQIGKAFRNEVTPRNFTFRSREFEQMELEFFIHPSEARNWYEFWRQTRFQWWQSLGLSSENLRLRDHEKDELSHYAQEGAGVCDVEYRFPFTDPDFGELEGIAHRSDFDLRQHAEHCGSGERMRYFDQEKNERYFPHVIEPSAGADRGTLAILCDAYREDETRPSKVYLKLHPRLAPIKAAIFPLVNKDGMPEVAEKLYRDLRKSFVCDYDAKQSVGKRYARMDEAGTPYCFTIDGQTLQDQTVTLRHRDTMQQERISIEQVSRYLSERLGTFRAS